MRKADINIDLSADPRLLASVRGLIRTYLSNEGFGPDRVGEVVLAVDEACTNAIRHSYGGSTDGRLRLTLRKNDASIEFVLRDRGVPVSKENCTRKEICVPDAATLAPGGLGVQLIYTVFDEVKFHPGKAEGNRVVMRLNLPDKTGGASP